MTDLTEESNNDINNKLVNFLRNLVLSIENNNISKQKLHSVGEFYMSYKMLEYYENNRDENADNNEKEESNSEEKEESNSDENSFEESDVIKFITLGWYIYKCILNKKNISESLNNYNVENNVKSI